MSILRTATPNEHIPLIYVPRKGQQLSPEAQRVTIIGSTPGGNHQIRLANGELLPIAPDEFDAIYEPEPYVQQAYSTLDPNGRPLNDGMGNPL